MTKTFNDEQVLENTLDYSILNNAQHSLDSKAWPSFYPGVHSMSYAIIGSGKVGQALATAFARNEIEVAIASRRSPEALAPVAAKEIKQ